MKILALETSTDACSVALNLDGEIVERHVIAPRRHAELILPMADELLSAGGLTARDLDAVAFGRGPGAFTGVRIAAGVAQGIGFALDLPLVPVSTLAALAQGTIRERGAAQVLAALDARMDEVYWGAFVGRDGLANPVLDEQVAAPGDVSCPPEGIWTGAGSGWGKYESALRERVGQRVAAVFPEIRPHAHDVALLGMQAWREGAGVPAAQALPVYLRDKVADRMPR